MTHKVCTSGLSNSASHKIVITQGLWNMCIPEQVTSAQKEAQDRWG